MQYDTDIPSPVRGEASSVPRRHVPRAERDVLADPLVSPVHQALRASSKPPRASVPRGEGRRCTQCPGRGSRERVTVLAGTCRLVTSAFRMALVLRHLRRPSRGPPSELAFPLPRHPRRQGSGSPALLAPPAPGPTLVPQVFPVHPCLLHRMGSENEGGWWRVPIPLCPWVGAINPKTTTSYIGSLTRSLLSSAHHDGLITRVWTPVFFFSSSSVPSFYRRYSHFLESLFRSLLYHHIDS
jgi:hypothetical protein